jgi:predicted nucleic acid-binding protein
VIAPDTSVVIAALAPWHVAHESAREALAQGPVRLVAHVGYETTSALSRMPEGHRIAPRVVVDALERRFPDRWLCLDGEMSCDALREAVVAGVRGGALYDALIAATVARNGARLLTADARARTTYEAVGVDTELLVV